MKYYGTCKFCGENCYTFTSDFRYDFKLYLASCPKGKADDVATEMLAEARYRVDHSDEDGGDSPLPPWGDIY
jgi:hypothetical protein